MPRASALLQVYILSASGSLVNHPENNKHLDLKAGRDWAPSHVEPVSYLKHNKRPPLGRKCPASLFQRSLKDWHENYKDHRLSCRQPYCDGLIRTSTAVKKLILHRSPERLMKKNRRTGLRNANPLSRDYPKINQSSGMRLSYKSRICEFI
jgi:hypothetical protein